MPQSCQKELNGTVVTNNASEVAEVRGHLGPLNFFSGRDEKLLDNFKQRNKSLIYNLKEPQCLLCGEQTVGGKDRK